MLVFHQMLPIGLSIYVVSERVSLSWISKLPLDLQDLVIEDIC